MQLSEFGKTIAKYAPLLGAALPIPGGEFIGELIAHEFGGDTSNLDDLATRISTDPNAQVKLAEIQANTKVQLQQLMVQNTQNQLAAQTAQMVSDQQDRADARKNNSETQTVFPQMISTVIILGFFSCFYLVVVLPKDNAYHDLLNIMMGALASGFTGVWNYWLGSSAGSRNKDDTIGSTLKNISNNN